MSLLMIFPETPNLSDIALYVMRAPLMSTLSSCFWRLSFSFIEGG